MPPGGPGREIDHDDSADPAVGDVRRAFGATVEVEVQVTFVNEDVSPGLKRGGVLNIVRREVELLCPADAIPESIVVDLRPFDIGDSIHISHIALPEGVRPTITARDFTVATISAPTVVTEEAAEEAAAEAAETAGEAEEKE